MFKNRVRTAALAGAVAVATGISGLAVPAFAEDNAVSNTIGGGFNEADNSAAKGVVANNVTERDLLNKTDATANYIVNHNQWYDLYHNAAQAATDGLDPSEEAAFQNLKREAENAGKQLAQAEQNVQDARASVAYALEKDEAANKAWDNADSKKAALNAAEAAAVSAIAPAVKAANAEGQQGGQPDLQVPATGSVADLKAALKTYEGAYDHAGERDADQAAGDFIPRDYIGLLETLISTTKDELGKVEAAQAAYDEAVAAAKDATREAQKSDVLVRQGFLNRAFAQVRVLRALEARFAVSTREIELRESPENKNVVIDGQTKTLRTAYAELITGGPKGILNVAIDDTTARLKNADVKALKGWNGDLDNFDGSLAKEGEEKVYDAMKEDAQRKAYEAIDSERDWEEAVKKVSNEDDKIIAQQLKESEQDEAQKAQEEKRAKESAKQQELLEQLIAAINNKNKDNTPAPEENGKTETEGGKTEGETEGEGKEGSSKLSPLGIAGIVVGVLGAIAAIFPFLGKQLNLQLPQLPKLPF